MTRKDYFQRNTAGVPESRGLYTPAFEHDSCGTGFVARIDGIPKHSIVEKGIKISVNLEHRGAVGGDKSTGDGAGLLVQLPHAFFQQECRDIKLPDPGEYGVGMIFLPSEKNLAEQCKKALKNIIQQEGGKILGWRQVPVQSHHLGNFARITEPKIYQLFVSRGKILLEDFERKLYIIRRLAEKEISGWKEKDFSQFYVVSLSHRTIVYKGLLTGTQLPLYSEQPYLCQCFCLSASEIQYQYTTNLEYGPAFSLLGS